VPSLRPDCLLLPEGLPLPLPLLEGSVDEPHPRKEREHEDGESQDLHAQGIGISSAPVQPRLFSPSGITRAIARDREEILLGWVPGGVVEG
jgi:hypothetical protein